jgi:integrase
MASIHRRPGSPYWRAAWRATDGTLIARSTKQTDRKKALAFALECERAEKLAGAGTLTEAQARDILNDILERAATGESLRCPSVREYLRDWLLAKEGTTADGTVARYGKSVNEFLAHLGDRADKPLSALTARQVETFVTARSKLGLSPSTVRIDAKAIRTALNKARRQGLLTVNPAEAVDLPGTDIVQRAAFSPAEVKMLVDAADGEWKTLILLAYYTGARLSDCCRMEWEAVDLANGVLTYTQGKTGKEVAVPIHPDLRTRLEGLAGLDTAPKFIMPGMADKGPGGRHGLSETFKGIMRKAGVDAQRVERDVGVRTLSRRTFHALRHSFTSALANAGVAPELRMKLTGHTTEAVHRGYTHHELETLRAAIGKLPEITKA